MENAMPWKTLDDMDLAGKTVLVRVDINVPMEAGRVTDMTRIDKIRPTVDMIVAKGGRTVLLAHIDDGLLAELGGMPALSDAETGAYILPPIRYPDGRHYLDRHRQHGAALGDGVVSDHLVHFGFKLGGNGKHGRINGKDGNQRSHSPMTKSRLPRMEGMSLSMCPGRSL